MLKTPSTFERVAEFTLSRPSAEIPEATRDFACWLLLDTLGIGAGAADMAAGRIARETALSLYGAGPGAEVAHLLFDGRAVSPAGAAYAAATQIDNLDGHDGYNPTKGHIGCAVVPALIALAEQQPDLTGPEALDAMVIAYEVAARAGLSLHATVRDYHTSGAWNALGVVALAARLRGMKPGMLRQALGIAEYHGPRSQMMREIDNPTMLHDGSGWGALAGVSAVYLAERGFEGAPAITLEAEEVSNIWADLGALWTLDLNYIKPYPICRWAHAAVDAVRALARDHELSPDQLAQVEVSTFAEAARLYPGMPEDSSKAQYSLRFAVATMLVHGEIGTQHISGAGLSDPAVAALMERITIETSARHQTTFPARRVSDVTITLNDGRVLASGDVDARGGVEAPLSADEIAEKFMRFAGRTLGEARAETILTVGRRMLSPGSRFSELTALLLLPAEHG